MSASVVLFYLLGFVSLVGAIGTVTSRNVVHAALYLVMSLIMVAGLYVLLFAEFLALVQVLIYGGAITILLLFALMLTRAGSDFKGMDHTQKPLAILAGVAVLAVLLFAVYGTTWPQTVEPASVAFNILGSSLFNQWAIPFEAVSLVLLVALIGAIIIARREERE